MKKRIILAALIFVLLLSSCGKKNEYEVNFNSNGGSEISSKVISSYKDLIIPENLTKDGFDFDGWYFDDVTFKEKVTKETLLERKPVKSLTIFAKWREVIQKYTITFNSDGGSEVAAITLNAGADIIAPEAPFKDGYTFVGWNPELPATMPAEDLVVKAKWEKVIEQYTITFNSDGGSEVAAITLNAGADIIAPEAPFKDGYTFVGWNPELPATMPAEDLVVKAKWEKVIEQYTITFNSDGGSEVAAITLNAGADIIAPEAPFKDGYTFVGWNPELPATMPAEDLVVKAKWEKVIEQYTITFNSDGGSEVAAITLNAGADIIAPEAPFKDGYTFVGWNPELPATMAAENLVVKAKWDIISYSITYHLNGGVNADNLTEYTILTPKTIFKAPSKDLYIFKGWFTNSSFEGDEVIELLLGSKGNIELYANWELDLSPLENAKTNLVVSIDGDTIILPSEDGNVLISWDSSHPEIISIEGNITSIQGDDVEVKLTATLTYELHVAQKTFTILMREIPTSIFDARALPYDSYAYIIGVVTGIKDDLVIVNDNTAAIYLDSPSNGENLEIGDKVKVRGKIRTLSNHRTSLVNGVIDVIKSNEELPAPLTSIESLDKDHQGQRIQVSDLIIHQIDNELMSVKVGTKYFFFKIYDISDQNLMNHISVIRQGTVIDLNNVHLGWNSNAICGYIFDISEITIKLSDLEKVKLVAEGLELPTVKNDFNKLTLPTTGLHGTSIAWTSSNEDIINSVTGDVNPPETMLGVTLKALVTLGEESYERDFDIDVKLTIEGFKNSLTGKNVTFTGVVTNPIMNSIVVNDNTAGVYVIGINVPEGLKNGDLVRVIGKTTKDSNAIKVTGEEIIILSSNNDLPAPITSIGNIKSGDYGQRVQINNLEVVNVDGNLLIVTDGINQITVIPYISVISHFAPIRVGTSVDLNGAHVEYTNTYGNFIRIFYASNLIIKLTDLEKAMLVSETLIFPETIEEAVTLDLIVTSTYESTISWESSNEAVINSSTGEVTLPETTETVALTATVKVNSEEVTKAFIILVKVPVVVKAEYTGSQQAFMELPNNARLLGLDETVFKVRSNAIGGKNPTYIMLASTGEMKLNFGPNGEGHGIIVSLVPSGYVITGYKITFGSSVSKIKILENTTSSPTLPLTPNKVLSKTDVNLNSISILNVGTGVLDIVSIEITYVIND